MALVALAESLRNHLLNPEGRARVQPVWRRLAELTSDAPSGGQWRELRGADSWWEAEVSDADRMLLTEGWLDDGARTWIAVRVAKHDEVGHRVRTAGSWEDWGDDRRRRVFVVPPVALGGSEIFRRWLESGERYLPPLLSSDPRRVLRNEAIVRLEGVPGSGKTVTLVHRLRADVRSDPDAWAGCSAASGGLVGDACAIADGLLFGRDSGGLLFAQAGLVAQALASERITRRGEDWSGLMASISAAVQPLPSAAQRFAARNPPDGRAAGATGTTAGENRERGAEQEGLRPGEVRRRPNTPTRTRTRPRTRCR